MSIPFYMDQHVRMEISVALSDRGIDVLTALKDGHDASEDHVILERASQLNRILFTQDSDFLALAAQRQRNSVAFSGVIYAHQLGITIGQCIADLELLSLACVPAEVANRVVYLPL